MLSGSIKIHKEPAKFSHAATYNSEEYWENSQAYEENTDKQKQIDNEIAVVKQLGFDVGTKVRRVSFNQHEIGEVIGFVKHQAKAVLYGGRLTVLVVKWPSTSYDSNCNAEELVIVKEAT